MTMPKTSSLLTALALVLALNPFLPAASQGSPETPAPAVAAQVPAAPTRTESLALTQLSQRNDFRLFGIQNRQDLEFTLRRDQLVTDATLELVFTPSPALLPKLSHLLVYLNDELMGVVPVSEAPAGQLQRQNIALDTAFLSTYNRVRLEFVGHYTDICEDLAHSSLWLDISRQTRLVIQEETLPVANDLSFFPEPFLDLNDMQAQDIPFVFGANPEPAMLEAAATLASYFGSRARWRSVQYPVHIDALPDHNAVVLATNDHRPAVLANYPPVEQPVIDMISMPDTPYRKLLLVLGRDSDDLKAAVQALSLGGALLRGQTVQVDQVSELARRRPYDAPNWVPTDRPVRFAELVEYPGQLETAGLRPLPIRLNLNLPPDLFVWRSNGIPLDLAYRYTAPMQRDDSRLTLSLNDRFVASYPLLPESERSTLARMHLQVVGNDPVADTTSLVVPALRVGAQNQIGLDFSFATSVGNAEPGSCRTQLPTDVRAAVDGNSSIDFTGYAHYLEMPNLKAFANSGFPFSRLADLSETVIVMPEQPNEAQVSTLLGALSLIGSQTGYPAYRADIVHDWNTAAGRDADLLWIGATPDGFRERPDANLLLNHTTSVLSQPRRPSTGIAENHRTRYDPDNGTEATSRVAVTATAPIGAIVGMASPFAEGRSMVGLLGTRADDLALLREALADPGKRRFIQGSVAIVRQSGVASEMVGPTYFVGQLRWWELLWFHLSNRPVLLSVLAAVMVLAAALLLWKALRRVARRRLARDA